MVRRTSNLDLLADADASLLYGDVADVGSMRAAFDGADVVFHVAGAIASLDQAGFDRVNRDGTANVAQAALEAARPPRRVVLVSSIAAGGPSTPERPRHEDDEPAPVSRYGRSKLGAERAIELLRDKIEYAIVRPPIVFGSGDSATLELYRGVHRRVAVRVGGPPRRLSYVHVRDLVEGLELVGTHPSALHQAFHLCGPETGTMLEFQQAIARVMGVRPVEIYVPEVVMAAAGFVADRWQQLTKKPRPFGGDKVIEARQAGWWMDDEKARRLLGFVGKVTLEEGIREAIPWYGERRLL